jgi:hypothetical protein
MAETAPHCCAIREQSRFPAPAFRVRFNLILCEAPIAQFGVNQVEGGRLHARAINGCPIEQVFRRRLTHVAPHSVQVQLQHP